MSEVVSLEYILSRSDSYRYRLLARLMQDCDYYLGNGSRQTKHLWALDEKSQIEYMRGIWNSFPEDAKPEWLTLESIRRYERDMVES